MNSLIKNRLKNKGINLRTNKDKNNLNDKKIYFLVYYNKKGI